MTRSVRYDFGWNWRESSKGRTERAIQHAKAECLRLVGNPAGKMFLDIGFGLHNLYALRLGAKSVTAFDYDPEAMDATREMLGAHAPDGNGTVALT